MKQRHLLSGNPINLANFPKLPVLTFYMVLFTCLLTTTGVKAIDITQQIHRPLNSSAGKSSRDVADRLLRKGRQQLSQGFPEKTLKLSLAALEIYHSLGDLKAQGSAYDLLANTYLKLRDTKNAEDAIRRQLAIARDNQDFQNQIFALNNLATLFLEKGENIAAEETLEDALVVARNIINIEGQGLSLSNLSLVAMRTGDYNKAVKIGEYALTFRRQIDDAIGEANTLNNLGDAYLAIGDYENTIGSYGSAMKLAKRSFERPNQLRAIDGLVTANTALGRYDLALELLKNRVILTDSIKNPAEDLKYLVVSGDIYEKMGNFNKAKDFYKQAISLAQKLEDSKQQSLLVYKINELKGR
ncbi:MAG: tetratricopeptide repeat protein [Dolichospermum sp. DET50]|nr:tetratricopeptide repeat protein [Dolichospermum sp. DET66]MBS3033234.1 tetratricopeptide repeat protein [Dolichospermum sp. DET67]MBS3038438.1 tetratricopeptide repeat protein [Dolichospermum sp. DET50]QSX70319.1 MAG: tetratricopeptide repeat protein [Dolichospermum sp. DET69]